MRYYALGKLKSKIRNPKTAIELTVLLFISYYGMKNTTNADSLPNTAASRRKWNRFKVVVKKTFGYSNIFFYYHLYHPERYYEKRYEC